MSNAVLDELKQLETDAEKFFGGLIAKEKAVIATLAGEIAPWIHDLEQKGVDTLKLMAGDNWVVVKNFFIGKFQSVENDVKEMLLHDPNHSLTGMQKIGKAIEYVEAAIAKEMGPATLLEELKKLGTGDLLQLGQIVYKSWINSGK